MRLCDNPICVRTGARGGGEALARYGPLAGPPVVSGTQRDNLALMAMRGRNTDTALTRRQRTQRSRALRAAVADGWDTERVAQAWFGTELTLF